MNGRVQRLAAWALQALTSTLPLQAHDVHQSTAEVEFNASTQRLEVSLNVFVSDLELALMRQAERELSLAKSPAPVTDAEIQRFLATHFVVKDAEGKPAAIAWTGRQIDPATAASNDPEVTLFFEVPLPAGLKGATLSHTVFYDRFADQLNLVHLHQGSQSTQLRFTKGEPARRLEFAP